MSCKLVFSLQVILQLTLITNTISKIHQKKEVYTPELGSKPGKIEEILERIYHSNGKTYLNEDLSDFSSVKHDERKSVTKEWNVVTDPNMIEVQHDKDTVEAKEIEELQWNPLAKDISYQIIVRHGDDRNENVSLFVDEETTEWSTKMKNRFGQDDLLTEFSKINNEQSVETNILPHFKQKSKYNFGNSKWSTLKKQPKHVNNKKGNFDEMARLRKSMRLSVDSEEQKVKKNGFDVSLKSDELLKNLEETINNKHVFEIKDIGVDDIGRENKKIRPVNETKDNVLLHLADDVKLKTPIKESQNTKSLKKRIVPKSNKNKRTKLYFESVSDEPKVMQQLKDYIKKEFEDLQKRNDAISEENSSPVGIILRKDKHYGEKLENNTEHWIPLKLNNTIRWIKQDLVKKNLTKFRFFLPKPKRKITKLKKSKKKKKKKIYRRKEKKEFKNNTKRGETYLININLQGVKDAPPIPWVKQTKDERLQISNNSKETTQTVVGKKSVTLDDLPIVMTSSNPPGSVESEIAGSIGNSDFNKVIADRQFLTFIKKLEGDNYVGPNLLNRIEDSSQEKDTRTIKKLKNKKKHNVHQWFVNTKNKTIDYFTRMGKKIKKLFKKKNDHYIHVTPSLA